jgi:hypothetical protein
MDDKATIRWLFIEFLKMETRAEAAELEVALYKSQFSVMEARRRIKEAASGRIAHSRFRDGHKTNVGKTYKRKVDRTQKIGGESWQT